MKKKISIGCSLFILLLSVFVSPLISIAISTEQNDVITNVSITDHNGATITSIGQWENFRINVSFNLPNSKVAAGDTTTLNLPNELRFVNDAFELREGVSGNVVAKATVDSIAKKIVLTYTDYVTSHSDIIGSFYFYAGVDTSVVNQAKPISTSIDVGKHTFPIHLDFSGIEKLDGPLSKSGWFLEGSDSTLGYYVAINRNSAKYPKVVIKDKIEKEGVTYVEDSFKIIKGTWEKKADETDWELTGTKEDVTENYKVEISKDGKSFSINFGDIGENDHFAIYYNAKLSYTPEISDLIVNRSVLESEGSGIIESIANTRYQRSGGEVKGYQYSIAIHKENETHTSLEGAVFEVVRDYDGKQVGTIITDAEGNGELKELLREDYTIKETAAPSGYLLSTEAIKISKNDFGADKKVTKTVINKRQTTPAPAPTTVATEIELNVNKLLIGKNLTAGAFSFELKDNAGKIIDTKTNASDGTIHFDPISYDKAGTYTYKISEIAGFVQGIIYDKHQVNVTVNVKEEEGVLVATAVYDGDQTFTNRYISTNPNIPESTADFIVLTVNKYLTGRDLTAGAFSFELKDNVGNLIDTKTNALDGTVSFDPIYYNKVGTYTYRISEVIGSEKGITYDTHIVEITVKVEEKDGKFIATAVYDGDQTFRNHYSSETISVPVTPVALVTPTDKITITKENKNLPTTNENTSFKNIAFGAVILSCVAGIFYHGKKKFSTKDI